MPTFLNYIDKGYGTPLILLHGNGESSEYFVNQIDYFSTMFRVIAVDTRGHGKSPRGEVPFTLEQFADDLKELITQLDIKKAIILGFSDGGNIAAIFAIKYPEYIYKLILNSANLYPSGLNHFYLFYSRLLYSLYCLTSKRFKGQIRKKELLSLIVNEPNINPSSLNSFDFPTLVIAGTNDIINKKHTTLIADSIPNSKLCFIKGTHSVLRGNSLEFNKAVQKFLEE